MAMKPKIGKGLAMTLSLLTVGLLGTKATALIASSVPGEQFVLACFGADPTSCANQRSNWQTTNWVAGWNRNTISVTVDGQLPVANSGTTTNVRGSFNAGDSCGYIVSDSSGNLVSTHRATATGGTQTMNLGSPTVLEGQALTVSCSISQNAWIGQAWQ